MSSQLEIVTRSKWGALPPKTEPIPLEHPIEYIWLRESPITAPCLTKEACMRTVQNIQRRDMTYFSDIQANFLIGDDGRVYEGRGWFVKPEKNERWEKYEGEYIEIFYIGPFDDIPFSISQKMLQVVLNIIANGSNSRFLIDRHEVFFLGDPPDFLE